MQVLDLLSIRERSVEELARLVGIGQSNLSQHLAALRQQRLVIPRRAGVNVYYGLSNPKIADACSTIREVLAELIAQDQRAAALLEVRR